MSKHTSIEIARQARKRSKMQAKRIEQARSAAYDNALCFTSSRHSLRDDTLREFTASLVRFAE